MVQARRAFGCDPRDFSSHADEGPPLEQVARRRSGIASRRLSGKTSRRRSAASSEVFEAKNDVGVATERLRVESSLEEVAEPQALRSEAFDEIEAGVCSNGELAVLRPTRVGQGRADRAKRLGAGALHPLAVGPSGARVGERPHPRY